MENEKTSVSFGPIFNETVFAALIVVLVVLTGFAGFQRYVIIQYREIVEQNFDTMRKMEWIIERQGERLAAHEATQ